MITVNTRQIDELRDKLGELQTKFAQRDTINDQAFETQKNARQHIARDMVQRNKWTAGSIRVDRARSFRDSAVTGSTERYMADQEFGHTDTVHTAMATPAASGEAPRAKVRRKPVRRANRMSAINLGSRTKIAAAAKQRNIVALKEAKESGRKFVFMQRGRRKGIYRVMGTKRKPRARLVQDLSRRVAVVPRRPWLRPSIVTPERTRQLFFSQMRRQLRRVR